MKKKIDPKGKNKKLKAAVVGVGNMGQHHARVYGELKETDLVAVCDTDVKRGKEIAKRHGAGYFRNYQKLLSQDFELDMVSVAVPTGFHFQVAKDFICAKKHILLEKPIADNLSDGKKIIELAKNNGVKLAIGHVERHNPAVTKLKEVIDRKKLGRIISIVARRVGGFPSQIGQSNVILDLAVHDIDIINYLLGEFPRKVLVHKGKFHSRSQEDSGEILMIYKKAAGFIQINWVTPIKIRKLGVTGTKGYAELNYATQELMLHKAKVERTVDNYRELIKMVEPKIERVGVKIEEPLKVEILDFVGAIKKNKNPLVTGKEALESLRVCADWKNDL